MGKGKGIWAVITGILVIGIIITMSTNKYIHNNENSLMAARQESYSMDGGFPSGEGMPASSSEEFMTGENSDGSTDFASETPSMRPQPPNGESAEPMAAAAGAGQAVPEDPIAGPAAETGAAAGVEDQNAGPAALTAEEKIPAETVLSPLGNGNSTVLQADAETTYLAKTFTYSERLEDLDAQIRKMKSQETDFSTNAMKNAADKEYKLWESERSSIYSTVIEKLEEESAKELAQEEKNWMKERDQAAAEASKKYNGGSLEAVVYTITLTESTRSRAYDLVDRYSGLLDGEN